MNLEERAQKAAELKATGQCNCTQSVLKVFEDTLPLPSDDLMKSGAGFAAGMGCMEATCGALIGAVMVAGFLTGGKGTPIAAKKILSDFKEKCGATLCRELKGLSTGKVLCECPDCCKNAVLSLKELVD
ncbi:C-GCAxxG-C-C family protein [Treponema berlinense]|uniref:C-GCAxxG-C-C family protein n=1 Tax=Treponema berlinense TaxID=225004 RepID=UPI0023F6C509|nr:C-GCAxxG-C-C family protein [Treponema berlinense]